MKGSRIAWEGISGFRSPLNHSTTHRLNHPASRPPTHPTTGSSAPFASHSRCGCFEWARADVRREPRRRSRSGGAARNLTCGPPASSPQQRGMMLSTPRRQQVSRHTGTQSGCSGAEISSPKSTIYNLQSLSPFALRPSTPSPISAISAVGSLPGSTWGWTNAAGSSFLKDAVPGPGRGRQRLTGTSPAWSPNPGLSIWASPARVRMN